MPEPKSDTNAESPGETEDDEERERTDPGEVSQELRDQAADLERHSRPTTAPIEPAATRPNPNPESGDTG